MSLIDATSPDVYPRASGSHRTDPRLIDARLALRCETEEVTTQRDLDLMRIAIEEATLSQPEDARPHPKVGAVLASADGEILVRAHRGEEPGGRHAEQILFGKARRHGIPAAGCSLFMTLEPCTRRGLDTMPCARLVGQSGVTRVWIGTLDPDPRITGRGETYLAYLDQSITLDRFPSNLAAELRALNKEFFDLHRDQHTIVPSLYSGPSDGSAKLEVARTREGALYQTADLMTGSEGDLWMCAGDMSWVRDLQPFLLWSTLSGRTVRVLRQHDPPHSRENVAAAIGLGLEVLEDASVVPIRCSLAAPGLRSAALLMLERQPTLHSALFRRPEDSSLVGLVEQWFAQRWRSGEPSGGGPPGVIPVEALDLMSHMATEIDLYRGATMTMQPVRIDDLCPMSRVVERFKLFRLGFSDRLLTDLGIGAPARIEGSPWLMTPPVVEELTDGTVVIIDGLHRIFEARSRGQESVEAIVVGGISPQSLPSLPLRGWDEIAIEAFKRPREERYVDYVPSNFRPLRAAYDSYVRLQG
jgi:pyrimidine deaminase RibD-like protein